LGLKANFDIKPKDLLNKLGVKPDEENSGYLVVRGQGADELTVEWQSSDGRPSPTSLRLQKKLSVEDAFVGAADFPIEGFGEAEALFAMVWLTAYADECVSAPEDNEIWAAGEAFWPTMNFHETANRLYDLLQSEGPGGIAARIMHVGNHAGEDFRKALMSAATRVVRCDRKVVLSESKFLRTLADALGVAPDFVGRYDFIEDSASFYVFNFADVLTPGEGYTPIQRVAAAFVLAAGGRSVFSRPEALSALNSRLASYGETLSQDDWQTLHNIYDNSGLAALAAICRSQDYIFEYYSDVILAAMAFCRCYCDHTYSALSLLTRRKDCPPADLRRVSEAFRRALIYRRFRPPARTVRDYSYLPFGPLSESFAAPQDDDEQSEDKPRYEYDFAIAAIVLMVVVAFRIEGCVLCEYPIVMELIKAAGKPAGLDFADKYSQEKALDIYHHVSRTYACYGPLDAARYAHDFLSVEYRPELVADFRQMFAAAWHAACARIHSEDKPHPNAESAYRRLFEELGCAPEEDGPFPLEPPLFDASHVPPSEEPAPEDPNEIFAEDQNIDRPSEEPEDPLEVLIAYFDRHHWLTKVDYRDPGVYSTYAGNNGQFNCYAKLRAEQSQLIFYSIFPMRTPSEKRRDMAEFIARANFGMVIGNFELDFNDGEVRYKSSIDFEGVGLHDKMLENLIHANILTMDRYLPGLYAVIYSGKSPSEIIEEIEKS
ncbi:MAG: YbjN domain-containing protein, partial [Bacteroidia bacterium]|nr:YbjN domain-containing protein [Bacteroidia bacterium]